MKTVFEKLIASRKRQKDEVREWEIERRIHRAKVKEIKLREQHQQQKQQ